MPSTEASGHPFVDFTAVPATNLRQMSFYLTESLETVLAKPRASSTYRYSDEDPSTTELATTSRFLRGSFSPAQAFEPLDCGLPPPWDVNPLNNRSWDFHRHSLEWVVALIRTGAAGDNEALSLLKRVISSWIEGNSDFPGASKYAWNDHAAAVRTRVLLFVWEALRRRSLLGQTLAAQLIATIFQHSAFLADPKYYPERSNHGLEMDSSLLAAVTALPEMTYAPSWRSIAVSRLEHYLEENFSSIGFHLEQSPNYHAFVTMRLVSLHAYMLSMGAQVPTALAGCIRRALSVWPFLVRDDGTTPMLGDTRRTLRPSSLRKRIGEFGLTLPRPVGDTIPNPREDGASLLVDEQAGYAFFVSGREEKSTSHSSWGLHLTVRCNAFQSLHRHNDAASLVLHAFGGEWLVDPGFYSMEERTPERQYMRSASAHNVVLVDNTDFELHPMYVDRISREADGDTLEMRHELPDAVHTRTVRVDHSNHSISLTDRIRARSDPVSATQLFHVHPRLGIHVDDRAPSAHLTDERNHSLAIHQRAGPLSLTSMSGDIDGRPVGWFSPSYLHRIESTVLRFSTLGPAREHIFATVLQFQSASTRRTVVEPLVDPADAK